MIAADGNSNDAADDGHVSDGDPRLSDLGFRLIEGFVSEEALDLFLGSFPAIRPVPAHGKLLRSSRLFSPVWTEPFLI